MKIVSEAGEFEVTLTSIEFTGPNLGIKGTVDVWETTIEANKRDIARLMLKTLNWNSIRFFISSLLRN